MLFFLKTLQFLLGVKAWLCLKAIRTVAGSDENSSGHGGQAKIAYSAENGRQAGNGR